MAHSWKYRILATPTRTIDKTVLNATLASQPTSLATPSHFQQNKMHPTQKNRRNPMEATPQAPETPQGPQACPSTGAPDTDTPSCTTSHQNEGQTTPHPWRHDHPARRANRSRSTINFSREGSACSVLCKTLPPSGLKGVHV